MPILPCKLNDYKGSTKWRVAHNGRDVSWLAKSTSNTMFSSLLNLPSISFPVSVPSAEFAIPINMELCTDTGNDRILLAIAQAVEDALGVRE